MNPESVLQNLENNILIGNAQSITDAILNYVNQNRNTQDATTLLNHIQQMVSYQKMKEQTIKQQVPVVEPKVQQDQINKPAAVPSLKEKPEITLYIKPARKTAKYFINYFPPKLYCSPYKYDLMIRLPVEVNDQYDLIFTLIDSETKERITKNTKGEEAYCIERTKTQRKNYLKPGFINATFRLNFSICSFHNFRRPFQISIHLRFKALSKNINNTGGDYNDDQLVYMSEAFSIFARKSGGKDKQANNDDDWGQLSPIGNNTNTTTTTSTTVTEVANEQKGTKENGEKRKRTKATDFTSKSATTTTEKKKRKKEKQSKPREEPVNNENKQISVSLEDELQLSIQNSPKSSPLPTTNIKLEIEQNSTDFSSFFENDFSQVLTPNSSHSIPSFDVNNSVQLEELNMINQPQQSLMHIPPQQTNNNCFNYSTPIVPQQQNVDLSMLVYQELLNQQQFNQQQQTANLISQVLANNYSTNNINYNTNNNYNNIFNQQQVQIPQQPTMAPEVLLLNQLLWQQQQQQTVQNTTIDPLELARLLFTRNNNNNNTNTNIGNNNNNFLPIDESMYSKYIGGNNNNNYFF